MSGVRGPGVVHVVAPAAVVDPAEPSGGSTYDRRLCEELARLGRDVRLHLVGARRPVAEDVDAGRLATTLASCRLGASVVVDGLVATGAPQPVLDHAGRLRLVLLQHSPPVAGPADPGYDREAAVMTAAAAVVTPSDWCRARVLAVHALDPRRVSTATPGADRASPRRRAAPGDGGELLVVGAVTPGKGQDLVLAALVAAATRDCRVRCVGPLTRDPAFVARLRSGAARAGLGPRFVLAGPLSAPALAAAYDGADLLVVASRAETYGLVVTEALARGLPVLATDVGGVPEALGTDRAGRPAGALVPADDEAALAAALARWCGDPPWRDELRRRALVRRSTLRSWRSTAERVAGVLAEASA